MLSHPLSHPHNGFGKKVKESKVRGGKSLIYRMALKMNKSQEEEANWKSIVSLLVEAPLLPHSGVIQRYICECIY